MGGAAAGPNPGWLLRSALASCSATVIAMRAASLGMALESLEVTVETDSDLRGLARARGVGRRPLSSHLHGEAAARMLA
jgi:uncharacterized OsmC-like protein